MSEIKNKQEFSDSQRQAVADAIAKALGDAYDCTRVWSAWGYGTMGPDDFVLVAEDDDRVAEIADAAIKAIESTHTGKMSEIRERAKEFSEFLGMCGWWATKKPIVDDLMAELERVESERDRLANDALTALAGVVCTPVEGFVKVPYELKTGILELRKLKEAAEQSVVELEKRLAEYEQPRVMDETGIKMPSYADYGRALTEARDKRIAELEAEKTALEHQVMRDGIATNRSVKHMVDRINELEAENDRLKDAISFDSPVRLAWAGDMVAAADYEKGLHDSLKGNAVNQFASQAACWCEYISTSIKDHFGVKGSTNLTNNTKEK